MYKLTQYIIEDGKDIKFDIKFPSDETALVLNKEYNKGNLPTILAGSTHAGEDEIIISAYKNLKNKIQNLKCRILTETSFTLTRTHQSALFI